VYFFLQATRANKNNYTSYNYEKADCDSETSSVSFASWGKIHNTLLELFCHQLNVVGQIVPMTSLDGMTVSVDCDVYEWLKKWLTLIDK